MCEVRYVKSLSITWPVSSTIMHIFCTPKPTKTNRKRTLLVSLSSRQLMSGGGGTVASGNWYQMVPPKYSKKQVSNLLWFVSLPVVEDWVAPNRPKSYANQQASIIILVELLEPNLFHSLNEWHVILCIISHSQTRPTTHHYVPTPLWWPVWLDLHHARRADAPRDLPCRVSTTLEPWKQAAGSAPEGGVKRPLRLETRALWPTTQTDHARRARSGQW